MEIQQLARAFMDMRQTTETVAKITSKFREWDLLVPQYATDKEMKKTRYDDMLKPEIKEFVSYLACLTLDNMIARACERKIDMEHIRKWKVESR